MLKTAQLIFIPVCIDLDNLLLDLFYFAFFHLLSLLNIFSRFKPPLIN